MDDDIEHGGLDGDLNPVDGDIENDGDQSDGGKTRNESQSGSENLPKNDDDWAAGLIESMGITKGDSEEEVDPSDDDDDDDTDEHQEVTPDDDNSDEANDEANDEDQEEEAESEDDADDEDLTSNSDSLSDKEWKNLNSKTRSQIKGLRKRAKEAESLNAQLKSEADFGNNINSMVSEVGATDAIFDSYVEVFEELYTNPKSGIQKLENILNGARKAAGISSSEYSEPESDVDPLLRDLAEEYFVELDDPRLQKLAAKLRHVGNENNRQDNENPKRRTLRNRQNENQTNQGLVDFKTRLKSEYPKQWEKMEPEIATEMMVRAKQLKKLGAVIPQEKLGELANEALQAVLKRNRSQSKSNKAKSKTLRSNQRRSTRRPRGDKQYGDLNNLIEDITSGRIR